MHYSYILYSNNLDKYYISETEDIEARLAQHNEHFFKGSFTSNATDWRVVLKLSVLNRTEARTIERYIKSMKSKRFITSIVNDVKYFEGFISLVYEKFNIKFIE
jgi:putative endonuclease